MKKWRYKTRMYHLILYICSQHIFYVLNDGLQDQQKSRKCIGMAHVHIQEKGSNLQGYYREKESKESGNKTPAEKQFALSSTIRWKGFGS